MIRYVPKPPRFLYWRKGAAIIIFVVFIQLAWTHHDSSSQSKNQYLSQLGVSDSWNVDWESWRTTDWRKDAVADQVQSVTQVMNAKEQEWCSEAEYLDGAWVTRDEQVTLDNIRRIYKYTELGQLKCEAREAGRESNPNPDDPAFWARITETAQYVWRPNSGCKQHNFHNWNFAKYCLRSKGGCSIVGDSLADQIYTVLVSSMISNKDRLFVLNPSVERMFNITVNRRHPDAAKLAAAAGVTMDRLDRPIMNYWREHHLIGREELDTVFAGAEGYKNWTGGSSMAENGWIWDRSWWFERWNWMLEQAIYFVPRSKDGAVPKEENSVISFSTGPHWTPVELWPKGYKKDTRDDMLKGYQGAVDTVIQNVTAVAKDHKVLAWWRSSVAAHPECTQYEKPENQRTTHHSTKNPNAKSFNWNEFPVYDQYVASKLDYEPSASGESLDETGSNMKFMNLWPLSVTRPDAHLKPQTDCMHFCAPGPPNEWLEFMWHLMVTGAENDDYDDPPGDDAWTEGSMLLR